MNNCCFLNEITGDCAALTVKACKDCKFRKTQGEYEADRNRAADILRLKGLEAAIDDNNGKQFVTTRKVKNDFD